MLVLILLFLIFLYFMPSLILQLGQILLQITLFGLKLAIIFWKITIILIIFLTLVIIL